MNHSTHHRPINHDEIVRPDGTAEGGNTPTTDQRLDRIEQSITQLSERLPEPKEKNKHASKGVVAAGFAFIGLKLVGFLSGKIGFLTDLTVAYVRHGVAGLEDLSKIIMPWAFKAEPLAADKAKASLAWTVTFATVGAFVGTVAGAILGWNRGHRIDSAGDLLSHPITSLKKMLAKEEPEQTKNSAAPSEQQQASHRPTTHVTEKNHQGLVASSVQLEHAL